MEFALAMPIVFVLILFILEMGFALYGYINVMYAAKEGARAGAVYKYQPDCDGDGSQSNDQGLNDSNRQSGTGCTVSYTDNIRASVVRGLGALRTTTPNFIPSDPYYLNVAYDSSVGSTLNARKGQLVTVQIKYRHYWLTGFFRDSFLEYRSTAQAQIE